MATLLSHDKGEIESCQLCRHEQGLVAVVDLGFKTLLTAQVISVAFYIEHEKSNFAQRL